MKIKLRVDRDKTLHWWFSVGGSEFFRPASCRIPGLLDIPTPAERRLQQHRARCATSDEKRSVAGFDGT